MMTSVELKSILDMVGQSSEKITVSDLEKMVCVSFSTGRNDARAMIRILIESGELEYSNLYGRSYLELSFSRPVRLSKHVVVKPPEMTYSITDQDVVINVIKGLSFGRGTHPTTRLCVMALDEILSQLPFSQLNQMSVVDVGTGSGILAITASKLGAGHVWACDIDPIAVDEAVKNVHINNLENRITVTHELNASILYDVIIANLRYPTLINLHQLFTSISNEKTYYILSGLKSSERDHIENVYLVNSRVHKIWEKEEVGWCAVVFSTISSNFK